LKSNGRTVAILTLLDPEFQVPPSSQTGTILPSTNSRALPPNITVHRKLCFSRKQDTKPWIVFDVDGAQMEATQLK
jgi:hypothetical protein